MLTHIRRKCALQTLDEGIPPEDRYQFVNWLDELFKRESKLLHLSRDGNKVLVPIQGALASNIKSLLGTDGSGENCLLGFLPVQWPSPPWNFRRRLEFLVEDPRARVWTRMLATPSRGEGD